MAWVQSLVRGLRSSKPVVPNLFGTRNQFHRRQFFRGLGRRMVWGQFKRIIFIMHFISIGASLVAQTVKNLPAMQETHVQSLSWEDSLEKGTATHSNILAWRIPWTEEGGQLQPVGSQ